MNINTQPVNINTPFNNNPPINTNTPVFTTFVDEDPFPGLGGGHPFVDLGSGPGPLPSPDQRPLPPSNTPQQPFLDLGAGQGSLASGGLTLHTFYSQCSSSPLTWCRIPGTALCVPRSAPAGYPPARSMRPVRVFPHHTPLLLECLHALHCQMSNII